MNEQIKIVKKLKLENGEELNFEFHKSFYDSIRSQLTFDNDYGLSIITKCSDAVEENMQKTSTFGLIFSSSAGSFEDGTFEVAIVKNGQYIELDPDDFRLQELEMIHPYNGGIFSHVKTENLEKIISIVKSFRRDGHV